MSEITGGKIQIYTGAGKGKTTAALGQALRAVGSGKHVAIVFFDKGGSDYNERQVLDRFSGEIDYWVMGRDRRTNPDGTFDFAVTGQDIQETKKGLLKAQELANAGKHDLLILDELSTVTALGMISVAEVAEFLKTKPYYLELIITGRDCPATLLQMADLVTEMRELKHYFTQGVPARAGYDY